MKLFSTKSLSLADAAARINCAKWPVYARYAAAMMIVAVATILRTILPLDDAPFLIYMPGMFVIGFLFGAGPSFLATLVSAAIACAFFASPNSHLILSWAELFDTLIYVLISLSLATLCDLFRQALERRESDLQATQAAKAALETSESFLRSVLESSPDCIKILDLEANLLFMNEGGMQMMEVSDFSKIEGCSWPEFWQGEHRISVDRALSEVLEGHIARFQGHAETMAGTPRWWDVVVGPIMGPDGKPEKILSISRDITEQKRSEAQQKLLNHELGHRLKNTLAMIQAIANQTLRRAKSLPEAQTAFDARLVALGKAQDVLTTTHWESAEIGTVVRNALVPHGLDFNRFQLEGRPVTLSSRCALALSLALHELATNATKYGALSVEGGRVLITWGVGTVQGEETSLRFHFDWTELGGPKVDTPESPGFGTFMIERTLAGYFKGKARIEYAPTGVMFSLDGPATRSESEFLTGEVDILAATANIN